MGYQSIFLLDNGYQFVSEDFGQFMAGSDKHHTRCPPYHPASKMTLKSMPYEPGTLNEKLAMYPLRYRVTSQSFRKPE